MPTWIPSQQLRYGIPNSGGTSATDNSSPERQHSLLVPWIRQDAWELFNSNTGLVYKFWAKLVLDSKSATIPDTQTAIRMVDGIISDENTPYWQRRLTQMQLARFLASLLKRSSSVRGGKDNLMAVEAKTTLLRDTYFRALEGSDVFEERLA